MYMRSRQCEQQTRFVRLLAWHSLRSATELQIAQSVCAGGVCAVSARVSQALPENAKLNRAGQQMPNFGGCLRQSGGPCEFVHTVQAAVSQIDSSPASASNSTAGPLAR